MTPIFSAAKHIRLYSPPLRWPGLNCRNCWCSRRGGRRRRRRRAPAPGSCSGQTGGGSGRSGTWYRSQQGTPTSNRRITRVEIEIRCHALLCTPLQKALFTSVKTYWNRDQIVVMFFVYFNVYFKIQSLS